MTDTRERRKLTIDTLATRATETLMPTILLCAGIILFLVPQETL
jgi:hypothetical protein